MRRMLLLFLAIASHASAETILLLRHGEKPPAGLGQLDCQGLNRALALPSVLTHMFGRPAAIFAPDPADQKRDQGRDYDYVRPLATIEPTAIALGLPVDASIGAAQLDKLQQALEAKPLHDAVVYVAWEHHGIVTLAQTLLASHGGTASVPDWPSDDFDRIYVISLDWSDPKHHATFEQRREGLDGQPTSCPP